MLNSVQRRRMNALFMLNFSSTIVRIVWCILILSIIFVGVVSLFSGTETEKELFDSLQWLFSSANTQRAVLLIAILAFLVFFILLWIIRWFLRNWIKSFPQEEREKYLLTWKKLREKQNAIIKTIWGPLRVIWLGFIAAVGIPVAIDVIEARPQDVRTSQIGVSIDWVNGPHLDQRLAFWGIVMFILLSLMLRIRARNLAREEDSASVKEWEPVIKSVDTAVDVLKDLHAISQLTLRHTDERLVKDLMDKIREPLQQQLDDEKEARKRLEEEVEKLKQPTDATSVSAIPTVSFDKEITQKLVK